MPQSFERATIGGFAATRSAGQASSGYGRFEDMVESVRVATPVGEWVVGRAPASAAGPDLKQLVIGSEGQFGVITEVSLRVRPKPSGAPVRGVRRRRLGGRGRRSCGRWPRTGCWPTSLRLSDADETEVALALAGGKAPRAEVPAGARVRQPCLVILGWECRSRSATMSALSGAQVVRLGRAMGSRGCTGGSTGLGSGTRCWTPAFVWRPWRLPRTGPGCLSCGTRCVRVGPELGIRWSMCHVSHAYETGASLYFTVLVPRDLADPVGQWQRAKVAASDAISRLGTITHHHAVGRRSPSWLEKEIGTIGVDVLRAVKDTARPDWHP